MVFNRRLAIVASPLSGEFVSKLSRGSLTSELTYSEAEAEAQRLVGQFLQSFATMEQALDAGIGKLLDIKDSTNDIVCSSIPFVKKVGVFFSSEGLLAAMPDQDRKKQLKDTRSTILALNEKRVMFAHNPFSADSQGGLQFRRVVANTKLEVLTVQFGSKQIDQFCIQAENISKTLDQLVTELKPYAPSLNFSDPRNSGYLAMLW